MPFSRFIIFNRFQIILINRCISSFREFRLSVFSIKFHIVQDPPRDAVKYSYRNIFVHEYLWLNGPGSGCLRSCAFACACAHVCTTLAHQHAVDPLRNIFPSSYQLSPSRFSRVLQKKYTTIYMFAWKKTLLILSTTATRRDTTVTDSCLSKVPLTVIHCARTV